MAHRFSIRDLALAFALTVVGVVAFWVVIDRSSQASASVVGQRIAPPGAPESVSAAGPAQKPAAPEQPAPGPNFVALPDDGTATLTVRDGQVVDLYAEPGGEVVQQLGSETEFASPTVLSVTERRGNWAGVPTHLLPNGELGWVRLDDEALSIDSVNVEIVVDVSERRAELRRDGEVEHSWTVSVGAAESPTPTGRFSITDKIEGGLDPVYGCCALPISATQPNLPSGWTAGNRMAIHGTVEALGAANSAGCVRTGESDLRLLLERVPLGTPVTIQP